MSARNNDVWTVQKKFGFADDDLKTSEHDKIMMWLDEKTPEILNWFFRPNYWPERTLTSLQKSIENTKEKIISDCEYNITKRKNSLHYVKSNPIFANEIEENMEMLLLAEQELKEAHLIDTENISIPLVPEIKCENKIWEYVITSGHRNQYTVGFIDLVAEFSAPTLSHLGPPFETVVEYGRVDKAFFEVKASIDSLGQLIRQVRLYQQYTGNRNWFVVSPDDSFEKQLKGQGIGFIKYKG